MRIEQIETPALILDLDVMERNMNAMDKLLEGSNARLRPHYKSNKCTAIAHMQMARGAKGICCAKLSEAEDLALAGIPDVLIANQITEPSKIARLAYLAGCCRLTVCVDDPANVVLLQSAAAAQNTVIHCLVEYDIGMDRCGVHTREEFAALARQIGECPNLRFDGIQAYAGNLAHQEDPKIRKQESDKVEERLSDLIGYLDEQGIPVEEVSGVSTDAGLKSVSVDQRPPRFVGYEGHDVDMSEEHCAIYGEGLPQKVGDRMLLIPSHCCTTVNLHDHIYFVRKGQVVDRVPVTGRGHSR